MRKRILLVIAVLFAVCQPYVYAQVSRVTGKVTDSENKPVAGASVSISGTTQGTVTDDEGNFELSVPSGARLLINSIGFADKIVDVGEQTNLSISLAPGLSAGLEEVVVTGYTAQRKKDITGAVSVVDVKAMKSVPSSSVMQALQGQAAGVNVINSGSPGEGSRILVRGVTSLGNVDPLVLVDGIQGNLNNIPPDDIESIQVLKDAGAAAIYGSRGANGVIIVTTKKGRAGKVQVNYDSWYNLQLPGSANRFDMLNAQEYATLYGQVVPTQLLFPGGVIPDYLYRGPGGVGQGGANEGDPRVNPANYVFNPQNANNNYIIQKLNKGFTDMFSEVFSPALWMNQNISASGGTDRARYMLSMGYVDHQGTLDGTWNKRYNLRMNSEFNLTKNIKIGENVMATFRNARMINANNPFTPIAEARMWLPFLPIYDIAGNYGGTFAGPDLGNWGNARASIDRMRNNRNNTFTLNGNVFADVTILKKFNYRSSFGGTINHWYTQNFNFAGYNNNEGFNGNNSLEESTGYGYTQMWTNTLTYQNTFGRHGLTALIGSESVENRGRQLVGRGERFFSDDYNYLLLNNAEIFFNASNGNLNNNPVYLNRLYSLFGRVDYNFDDKYMISGVLRRDGYSAFGEDTKFGVFPSISLGWRISQESFLQNVNWITDLKLRASYGAVGNKENLSPNNPFTLFAQGPRFSYYDMNGTSNSLIPGFYASNIGNPSTRWERNLVSNFGLDATLFNNALDVNFEVYRKEIDGLIFQLPLPATVGEAARPYVNIGDIRNTGIDLALTYRRSVSRDFNFSIGANIGAYKMTVVDIPDPGQIIIGQMVTQEGYPSSSFFGYKVEGIFRDADDVNRHATQQDAAPGRLKFADVNGDGEITAADRTITGNPHPDFTYGLNLAASFKQFDFSAIFYGSQGNDIYNYTRSYTDFWGGNPGNKSRRILDAWTPNNLDATVPIVEPVRTFSSDANTHSSYFVEDGSYFRLRSLVVAYNFAPSTLSKVGINNLRVYLQGTNLFTITKYTGLDPEIKMDGVMFFGQDNANYPIQKSFLLGINLGF